MNTKSLFVAVAAACCALNAQAEESRSVQFALTGGLTYGGDEIANITYEDGDTSEIRAGSLFTFGAGALWTSTELPLAIQATLNYHVDRANAKNGDATFSRVPLEVLAFYTGVEKARFGGGLRYVTNANAKLGLDGVGDAKIKFKNSLGVVLEAGYQVSKQAWVNARVGFESYKPDSVEADGTSYDVSDAEKIKGNFGGVNLVVAF